MKQFFKHPLVIVAVVMGITVFFSTQLGKLEINNSLRIYLPQEHESYRQLVDMEDHFGSSETVGIVFESPKDGILSASSINLIQNLTKEIENLDGVDNVRSLTNIEHISGEDGALTAQSLVSEDFSGSNEEIALIGQKIADWGDMYERVILSDDGKSSQMAVTMEKGLDSAQKQKTLDAIRSAVNTHITETNINVIFVGDPVVSENAGLFMKSDLVALIPLVIAVVILCLFLSFRSVSGTLLPLVTVLISSIWSLGIMAMLNITFSIISSVIPVALIAIGSAYGIHVMNHYNAELQKVPAPGKAEHADIIFAGLKSVLPAVSLAAITTVAGFVSLVTSPLVPLRSFAIFTALGIVFSFLLALTLVPAILMLKSEKSLRTKSATAKEGRRFTRRIAARFSKTSADGGKTEGRSGLYKMYRVLAGSPRRLVVLCVLLTAVSWFGIRQIVTESALINYFPANSPIRTDIDFVDRHFAGTNSIYLIVSGEKKGDLTNPEILKPMDDLQNYLSEKYPEIGKVVSFSTFVKKMNQVMHIPEDPAYYENVAGGTPGTDLTEDGFGDSDFGAFSFDDSSFGDAGRDFSSDAINPDAGTDSTFIDPNAEFSRKLYSTITIKEGMELLEKAFVQAGGNDATARQVAAELEKELNYNGSAYYEIPWDADKYPAATRAELQDLVSQYLLLFSGSLDDFIDDPLSPQTARVTIQMRTRSSSVVERIINDVQTYAENHFPDGYSVSVTGNAQLENVMTKLIVNSQLSSLLLSLVSVFLILAIYFKSPFAGLVGIVPLFFTILLNYMAMGLFHINLDLFTSLIASIAVGVGIDYTIHFMTNYREERRMGADGEIATQRALQKSGRGIVTNALSVGLGFLVLCLSRFVVLRYIGILAATVMFTSSVMAMTVVPGILNLCDFAFMRKKSAADQHKN